MRLLPLCALLAAMLFTPLHVAAQAEPEAAATDAEAAPVPSVPTQDAKPEAPRAKSLDELLGLVRKGLRVEKDENQKREAEFVAQKREQQRLLNEAVATREAEEYRSEQLEKAFEENEGRIAELEDLLAERLGNLGELFGVVRQVAGDTRSSVESSLVSAQLPDRAQFLAELGQSKSLPRIKQLEQLWFLLQQEMTESGKVVRFPAKIVLEGGAEAEREVVRIGVFNAVADGRYLRWLPDVGRLAEFGSQPARKFVSTLSNLDNANGEMVRVAIDPARGSLLALLVQTPNFEERIQAGGTIGYVIIGLGSVTLLLALGRLIYVFLMGRRVKAQVTDSTPHDNNPLGRILAVFREYRGSDAETLELKLDEAILRESSKTERYLWAIKVVAAVAPLLGLLGTVTGMITTFQMITLFGTGDPKMMASGISEALVTTMLGLTFAIPLVLLHSWVSSMAKGVNDVLEEQSAGIVAQQAEGDE